MTGEMPYQDTVADYAIIRKIFESPSPQVDGASRLGDSTHKLHVPDYCHVPHDLGVADAGYWTGHSLAMQSREDEALPLWKLFASTRTTSALCGALIESGRFTDGNVAMTKLYLPWRTLSLKSGDKLGEVNVTQAIGYLLWEVADISKATTVLTTSRETARKIGYDTVVCEGLYALDTIKFGQGSYGKAEDILKDSIAFARRTIQTFVLAKSFIGLAKFQQRRGELSEAVVSLEESWSSFQTISLDVWHASLLAQIKAEQGDLPSSMSRL
ncbi:hypothetical protein FRC04_006844 [Tulasnella sp. 424]|nr:hypothetical protein FRC04_006844 [Tulasnella sp. 424]KAG8974350.1 hypothetical protein FRC05_007511 [Tulasnella sp. 425]